MILDTRDYSLLRLAGAYRYVPLDSLGRYGFDDLQAEIELLAAIGLVAVSKRGKYFKLRPRGYELLDSHGYHYEPGNRRTFEGDASLIRRLNIGSVMLTCLRAGIATAFDGVDALREQPAFYPAFALRNDGTNLMNAASCVGFGNWGDCAYMLQYVGAESRGMYLVNELSRFHNLSSIFSEDLKYPKAMIFAGESCEQVYARVRQRLLPENKSYRGYTDYSDVYAHADLPIHLLSCDETGASQLAVMRQTDYNAKITRAAFGDRLRRDTEIPDADGYDNDITLVVGADMNVRRVLSVVDAARVLGRREVVVAALPEQVRGFYEPLFENDKFIVPKTIGGNILASAFGKSVALSELDKSMPATGPNGGVINA